MLPPLPPLLRALFVLVLPPLLRALFSSGVAALLVSGDREEDGDAPPRSHGARRLPTRRPGDRRRPSTSPPPRSGRRRAAAQQRGEGMRQRRIDVESAACERGGEIARARPGDNGCVLWVIHRGGARAQMHARLFERGALGGPSCWFSLGASSARAPAARCEPHLNASAARNGDVESLCTRSALVS